MLYINCVIKKHKYLLSVAPLVKCTIRVINLYTKALGPKVGSSPGLKVFLVMFSSFTGCLMPKLKL